MTRFQIKEHPGREQPFTIWAWSRLGRCYEVVKFCKTGEEAAAYVARKERGEKVKEAIA